MKDKTLVVVLCLKIKLCVVSVATFLTTNFIAYISRECKDMTSPLSGEGILLTVHSLRCLTFIMQHVTCGWFDTESLFSHPSTEDLKFPGSP